RSTFEGYAGLGGDGETQDFIEEAGFFLWFYTDRPPDLETPLSNVPGAQIALVMPYWFLTLAATAWPLMWLVRRRPWVRPEGLCRQCGYDLRASTERCPECGTSIPAAGAANCAGSHQTCDARVT